MCKSVYYLRTTRLLGCFVTASLCCLSDQCPACIFCLRQRKTAIVLWFCLPGSALLRYFRLLFLPATFLYTVHPGTMCLSAVHFVRFINRVETGVFGDSKPGLFLDVCVILQESPVPFDVDDRTGCVAAFTLAKCRGLGKSTRGKNPYLFISSRSRPRQSPTQKKHM